MVFMIHLYLTQHRPAAMVWLCSRFYAGACVGSFSYAPAKYDPYHRVI